MKKLLSVFICFIMVLSFAACGSGESAKSFNGAAKQTGYSDIDVDLTILSSTMVYSQVSQMMQNPDNFIGKTVKMNGTCSLYYNQNDESMTYYACVIKDATACCSQGLEFQLKNDKEYPELDSDITVVGVFSSYKEDNATYYRIDHAEIL